MADNSLDDLDREASERRRRGRGGGGRNPGESRFPRTAEQKDDAETRRREELRRRQEERDRRRRGDVEEQPVPPETPPTPTPEGDSGRKAEKKSPSRPKSMPFYPNPEHESFLWRITEAGSARHKRIPATAVLRLALSRLEQQMTPSEIVQALGSAEQPEGKMGRPRL